MGEHLMDYLSDPKRISSVSVRGRSATITFGATKVRNLSDGAYPVEVWRVHIMADGRTDETLCRTVTKPSTLKRAKRDAARGWPVGVSESWVELRTPKARMP